MSLHFPSHFPFGFNPPQPSMLHEEPHLPAEASEEDSELTSINSTTLQTKHESRQLGDDLFKNFLEVIDLRDALNALERERMPANISAFVEDRLRQIPPPPSIDPSLSSIDSMDVSESSDVTAGDLPSPVSSKGYCSPPPIDKNPRRKRDFSSSDLMGVSGHSSSVPRGCPSLVSCSPPPIDKSSRKRDFSNTDEAQTAALQARLRQRIADVFSNTAPRPLPTTL